MVIRLVLALWLTLMACGCNEHKTERDEGARAAAAGLPVEACPYSQTLAGQIQRECWIKGWTEAKMRSDKP